MPYIVGEKGPGWFVPNKSGTILPNSKLDKVSNNISNIHTETSSKVENHYNLTANYPQESQMSLIERVKVLEALG
jgi:DNA-binding GntR family transcriptional regulator